MARHRRRRRSAAPHAGRSRSRPAFRWTGFYVGTHTGVAVGKTTTSNVAPYGGFDAGVPLSYDLNPVSIFGGGQFGYNWQYGVYVFGVEADIGYLGLRETIRPAPDDYVSVQYGWYGTVTGRLGLAYDRLLAYVKGGAAVASITNSASRSDRHGAIDPSDFSETKKTRWGWTVGTRLRVRLRAVLVGQERVHVHGLRQAPARPTSTATRFEHKNQVHTLKVGLNYRWGGASRRRSSPATENNKTKQKTRIRPWGRPRAGPFLLRDRPHSRSAILRLAAERSPRRMHADVWQQPGRRPSRPALRSASDDG